MGDDSIPTGKSVINKSGVKKIAFERVKDEKKLKKNLAEIIKASAPSGYRP